MLKVTSKEFQLNLEFYQALALNESVQITLNGQDKLILINAEEYKQLRKRERTAFSLSSLSDDDIQSIKMTKMSEKHNQYNSELNKS